jgi:uncharacterized protein YqjF (DUF2071 family)
MKFLTAAWRHLILANYCVPPDVLARFVPKHTQVDVLNTVSCRLTQELDLPAAGSQSEFITEHYWGYTRGATRTLEYRVDHPPWRCCEVDDYTVSVDYADTYGDEFGFLSTQKPFNVLYAEGSGVTVNFPSRVHPVP